MPTKESIEKILLEKKIPKMEFYDKIGMTSKGFKEALENESLKISMLRKICAVLNLPITFFFTESNSEKPSEVSEADVHYGVNKFEAILLKLVESQADTALAVKLSTEASKINAEATKNLTVTNQELVTMASDHKKTNTIPDVNFDNRLRGLEHTVRQLYQDKLHPPESDLESKEESLKVGLKGIEKRHKERYGDNDDAKGNQGN